MKFIILMLSVLLSTSCTSMTSINTANSSEDRLSEDKSKAVTLEHTGSANVADLSYLNNALVLAKKNNDYRLMVTSGRSLSIPGVKASDYQAMIELCGKKYSAAAGDVITSEDQRLERKKLVNYMRQYNEQMLIICQENNK